MRKIWFEKFPLGLSMDADNLGDNIKRNVKIDTKCFQIMVQYLKKLILSIISEIRVFVKETIFNYNGESALVTGLRLFPKHKVQQQFYSQKH